MKRTLCFLLAAVMLFSCAATLAACNQEETAMTLNVGAYPNTIDPALNAAADSATYILHAFTGLVGYEQDEEGDLQLVPQCAKELPTAVKEADGKVSYTFQLRDDLKWSDGSALTAQDFVYAWNRAADPATGAGYGYMFDCIDGYSEVAQMYETTTDAEGNICIAVGDDGTLKYKDGKKKLNVTASDDGKKLTVVLTVDLPYFNELCAFPTYMPVKEEVIAEYGDDWTAVPETYIGNGPYKVTEFSQTRLVLEKNRNYFDADKIASDKLIFAFDEDDTSILTNYKNGNYLFIDSVPGTEIEALKEEYKDQLQMQGQLSTYCICMNVNDAALQGFAEEEKVKIRQALSLMIDRNYVVTDIGQAGQVAANGFVASGLTEPDGSEFVSKNGVNGDGSGYFSVDPDDYKANCDEAIRLLTEVADSSGKFTVEDNKAVGFPTLTYITNESSTHAGIAEYLRRVWGNYGIALTVELQTWADFLNSRQSGDYSIARYGWVGDYNDPISFLDIWTTGSGNNDCGFGSGGHASYKGYSYGGKDGLSWAESFDACIAAIKAETDAAKRFELMHRAESILMSTGAICPLYFDTDIYMCSDRIEGFFSSPLGYKFFMYASVKDVA